MAKRKRRLRCNECGELIDFEDLVYCERCDAPLHEWCTTPSRYFEDGIYCSNCAEELDEEIEDSDEYGYTGGRCPNCGVPYVKEENLVWCPNCGYEPY